MPTQNQINLQGRAAIVTGGASGIGLAIAQRLAQSGARISVWDRDAQALATFQKNNPTMHTTQVDIAQATQVAQALATSLAALGKVDILVCSAAINGVNTTTIEYPVEEWQRVLDINLTGTFLCNRALAAHMSTHNYGRIVNIASIAGKEGNPNAVAYSASKAGVISLTKSLGKELAKTGVSVNCIAPAVIRTPMLEQATQAHVDYMISKIPMARVGEVAEVAALVAWLASEECSFSTGAVFDLSGGRATY